MDLNFKRLKNHQGFRKYLKNTSWLFAEKVLRMVVGIFVSIWVARYLGPEQFGLFSYAKSFTGIFAVIATLGLNNILVRDIVKNGENRDVLLGTAFWLKFMGSIFVLILLAFAINFTSNDHNTNILIFIIASATIFQSFNVIDFYFQSKVLSRFIVFANTISLVLSSIIKIILIINDAPLIAFAYAVLFDSFVLAIGFVYFYLKQGLAIKDWVFKKSKAISLLKDSWPLILSGLAIMVYLKVDQVMIKEMLGNKEVGNYAAAVSLSEPWYFIAIVIVTSLFPALINAKKQSEELFTRRLKRLYSFMIWIAIAVALPMTFLSEWLVSVLYGKEYDQAGSVLTIHIWASVFVFIGVASGKWLIVQNLQVYSTLNTITGAIINIILNYILIKKIGINGAAWATVISYAFSGYILLFIYNKTRVNFKNISKSFFLIKYN